MARTRLSCSQGARAVELRVAPVSGSFENMPGARDYTFKVALGRKPSRVLVNGKALKGWSWSKDGQAGTLSVSVPGCSVFQELSVKIQL